jgi:hypothetical protein
MRDGTVRPALDQQRQAMRRARRQGYRWYVRAALMIVIAFLAFNRGGQLYRAVGIAVGFLAVLSWSLGRSMRRQAAQMEAKIDLMEKAGTTGEGEGTEARRHGGTV